MISTGERARIQRRPRTMMRHAAAPSSSPTMGIRVIDSNSSSLEERGWLRRQIDRRPGPAGCGVQRLAQSRVPVDVDADLPDPLQRVEHHELAGVLPVVVIVVDGRFGDRAWMTDA